MWQYTYSNFKKNAEAILWPMLAMFFAAAVLTAVLTFGQSDLPMASLGYRQVFGGDILLFTEQYVLPKQEGDGFVYRRSQDLSDIHGLYPHISIGYMGVSTQEDMDIAYIVDIPGVVDVTPSLLLPIKFNGRYEWLRGRVIHTDIGYRWDDVISEGRYFLPQDDGEPVALSDVVGANNDIEIMVPKIVQRQGETAFDFALGTSISLTVVGNQQVAVDRYRLVSDAEGMDVYTNYYFPWNGILVPEQTWHNIFTAAGGAHLDFVSQYVVSIEQGVSVAWVVAEIERKYPTWSVLPVAELDTYTALGPGQGAHPIDLDSQLVVVVMIIAGLMVASNIYLSVMKRKREIAILKAIGATRVSILRGIIIEMLLVSIVSSVLGVAFMSIFTNLILLGNKFGLLYIATLFLNVLARVTLLTVSIAVVFGFIPAAKAASMTCMEVLRDV